MVNEMSANVTPVFPPATAKPVIKITPVIKPTCPNLLPLVEIGTESLNINVSTPVMYPVFHHVSQRSRKFMGTVSSFLVMAYSSRLPLMAQSFLDYHLEKIMDYFFPTSGGAKNRSSMKAFDVVESVCDLFFFLV